MPCENLRRKENWKSSGRERWEFNFHNDRIPTPYTGTPESSKSE